ncbi:hypothetical protein PHISCL_03152 [Aspergillus sclerotialis]|uniref:Uncharacterized protein n=1 Tax=Aspergillus sclerotialis TaxID=2070753 RepID=A0A3A2ZYR6_9EURO|nr:hypothetical protein PHISCL_03152 [Aspergillus sclerotialis]
MANANANASSTPRCSFDSVEMNSPVAYGIADLVNPFNEIEGTRDFIDSGISPEITPVTDHTVNRDFPDGLVMRAYRCEVDLVVNHSVLQHFNIPGAPEALSPLL